MCVPSMRRAVCGTRSALPTAPGSRSATSRARPVGWATSAKSCWALMVVMTVVGHASLVWMAGITVLIAIEEMTLAGRRLLAPLGAGLGAAAAGPPPGGL